MSCSAIGMILSLIILRRHAYFRFLFFHSWMAVDRKNLLAWFSSPIWSADSNPSTKVSWHRSSAYSLFLVRYLQKDRISLPWFSIKLSKSVWFMFLPSRRLVRSHFLPLHQYIVMNSKKGSFIIIDDKSKKIHQELLYDTCSWCNIVEFYTCKPGAYRIMLQFVLSLADYSNSVIRSNAFLIQLLISS